MRWRILMKPKTLFHTQPLPPLPCATHQPSSQAHQRSNNELYPHATVSTTTQTTSLSTIKPATSVASTTTPTGIVKPTPSIAVTHTLSIEREEKTLINLSQRSKPVSPSKRKDIKKHLQHKSKHSTLDRIHRWEHKIDMLAKDEFCRIREKRKINNLCCRHSKRAEEKFRMINFKGNFSESSRDDASFSESKVDYIESQHR